MIKTKAKAKRRKLLILLAFGIALVGVGAFAYQQSRSDKEAEKSKAAPQTGTINLKPATKQDKERGDQNKQQITERDQNVENQQPAAGSKKTVKPVITYASQLSTTGAVEVGGYVNGVFEDGGTCTATFTLGNSSFTKTVTAVKNVNSVNCPVMSAAGSELNPKGTWSITVSYDSATASGVSDTRQVEVK